MPVREYTSRPNPATVSRRLVRRLAARSRPSSWWLAPQNSNPGVTRAKPAANVHITGDLVRR
jgi:hypothetical protein